MTQRANTGEVTKGLFRKMLDKYNELCRDMGVDNGGGCRRCVPIVKQDPEPEKPQKKAG
ncbi:DUF5363 domain-containing protein [Chelonobacter oris]|uniref:DUF5363 domain-containing protein n=1 Tax=Chelonobacter oris TaxID=505317 RepID=UPI0013782D72|nr:DUF5363 domain-containing protein [Chelonobacter oris]